MMHVPQPVAKVWADIGSALPFSEKELLVDVARLKQRHPVVAVYVGGSRVDGYGNNRSDVDVYALVDGAAESDSRDGFEVSFIHRQPIQYDYVSVAFVEGAINQLRTLVFEEVRLSIADIRILHRLCKSVAVLGKERIDEYRAQLLEAGFPRFCAYKQALECDNAIQDAYGAWESGHIETAIYMLRTTVQFAFDAVVSLAGETANSGKWIFPRSIRALGQDHPLCLRFRSLYDRIPNVGNSDDVEQCFARSFRFVQVCMDTLYANGVGSATGSTTDELSVLSGHVLKGLDEAIPNRKSPFVFLRRALGKHLLYHRGLLKQELSERAGIVWLCIIGRLSADETATVAAALRPDLFPDEASALELTVKLYRTWTNAEYLLY